MKELTVQGKYFLADGHPFRIVAGAMHYFRVPREYWKDRLLKIKACGFNAIETYVAWNMHEPREREFDFSDNLDLDAYLSLIEELGMLAIVRPGPYICSEWEFGGLPWWLLKYDAIRLRCADPLFLSKVANYYERLIPIIASHQLENCGSVAMVQVENEYGSYGNDSSYLRALADMLRKNGLNCLLFTSDGASDWMVSGGTVPELFAACNFGSRAAHQFKEFRKYRDTDEPLMCAEYWNGWFDHWTEAHHTRDPEDAARGLAEILDCGASVSVYMMHGGTNFGFMNGANCYEEYQPTVNSYDDDAPISENGSLTKKYFRFKDVLGARGFVREAEIPFEIPCCAYGTVPFTRQADFLQCIGDLSLPVKSAAPMTMEALDQGYGFVCYKTVIRGPREKQPLLFTAHDRAYVFADDKFIGMQYRNDKKNRLELEVPAEGLTLTILVENMGRVNYGPAMSEHKGLIGPVRLGQQILFGWENFPLPLDNLNVVQYDEGSKIRFRKRPVLLGAELEINGMPQDTFVKLPGFKKGVIFVNGRALSRYWEVGPQRTAYLPATFLRPGVNDIVVLELEGFKKPQIVFCDTPDIG
ncbi:MAG: beta-galactosidase [Oscillospiraceae bacterium]|nr:beta-galactosidase [Oscillospiraceae bacterium]